MRAKENRVEKLQKCSLDLAIKGLLVTLAKAFSGETYCSELREKKEDS